MVKKATLHPPNPKRAKTRSFPSRVLVSSASSTYPGVRAGLGRLMVGRVKYWYACGFFSPTASLAPLFEHPPTMPSRL